MKKFEEAEKEAAESGKSVEFCEVHEPTHENGWSTGFFGVVHPDGKVDGNNTY